MIISSLGRFVHCLANILLMAYHTSCYINTKCQVLIQQQSFIFLPLIVKQLGQYTGAAAPSKPGVIEWSTQRLSTHNVEKFVWTNTLIF